MDSLKLMALDAQDLDVVSAHVQDAVCKVSDLSYSAKAQQFSLIANRFVWEKAIDAKRTFERRRAVLLFKRVRAVRFTGFDRKDGDTVLSLLTVSFRQVREGPEGTIELVLAGKATIALDVECIEVQLADSGGAWETGSRPRHPQD